MRIAIVTKDREGFVDAVNRRFPSAVINHTEGTAKLGTIQLIMVNTAERTMGHEFDKAWFEESAPVELETLVRSRVRVWPEKTAGARR